MKFKIVIYLLVFSSLLYADPLEQLYKAIEKIDYGEDLFSYESRVEISGMDEDSVQVISYSPLDDPKYTLISKDGKTPTEKDIKAFKKQREREGDDRSTKDILGDEFILESTDNGIAIFSFVTTEDMIPKKESKMNGKVWLDLETSEITKIELNNTKPISIFVGVSIKKFVLDFTFESYSSRYTIVTGMNFSIKGKAAMIEFNQSSTSKLYNYDIVGVDGDI